MKTSCFHLYSGPGRISIARWAPRNCPPGYRVFSGLAPGRWFHDVDEDDYIDRYTAEVLGRLDAQQTWDRLVALAAPHEPVLLCWERPPFVAARTYLAFDAPAGRGKPNWCHRRLVAHWFEDQLGIEVPELLTR